MLLKDLTGLTLSDTWVSQTLGKSNVDLLPRSYFVLIGPGEGRAWALFLVIRLCLL